MIQIILVWARPLFALGRFYLHLGAVKRRFMRLQQRRLTHRPQPASAHIAAAEAFPDLSRAEYRDAA
jgi:hypothetical protein